MTMNENDKQAFDEAMSSLGEGLAAFPIDEVCAYFFKQGMAHRNKQAEPVAWRYCVAVTHRQGKGYINRIKTSKLVCTMREAEVIQKDWQSWTRTGVFTVEIFPVYTHPAPSV